MLVKVGDPIQLNLQLEDGSTNQFPRAILRNQLGILLAESPVDLTHTGEGLYQNDSVFMPNTQEVTATYKVYTDFARTLLSERYSIELDVFERNLVTAEITGLSGGSVGDIKGYLDDSGAISALLIDSGRIIGMIEDEGDLKGFIEEFELTGILKDSGDLIGYVATC